MSITYQFGHIWFPAKTESTVKKANVIMGVVNLRKYNLCNKNSMKKSDH